MEGSGNILCNVINCEVEEHYEVESQCHQRFKDSRRNGEWFSVDLEELIAYFYKEIDWCSIDFECPARLTQYLIFSKKGNHSKAKNIMNRN